MSGVVPLLRCLLACCLPGTRGTRALSNGAGILINVAQCACDEIVSRSIGVSIARIALALTYSASIGNDTRGTSEVTDVKCADTGSQRTGTTRRTKWTAQSNATQRTASAATDTHIHHAHENDKEVPANATALLWMFLCLCSAYIHAFELTHRIQSQHQYTSCHQYYTYQ